MSCIVRRLKVRNRIVLALVEIHNPTWDDLQVSVQHLNKSRNLSELTHLAIRAPLPATEYALCPLYLWQ